ncbi:MAG: transcriptional repressor TetR [Amycolatopsis sp.]|uniref:TetR/AcrR family transcriptional regulator n=1 Tax=Amycolatopsis sp. TaxID=37632 RepID=UPI00260475AD|nr:TetR/AcrR family transcriptional regulator [Amycolatopsis sp.]MCU1684720.1 transcriptional repressor TetR [Amycolatopsis sp.]
MPVDRVIAAAVELVDEVGPGEFSMRLLAQRLRSSTATLYRHFAGKDEIFVHVVEHVLGEVPRHLPELPDEPTWQDLLGATADALFRTLKEHPNVAALFGDQVPLGPRALAGREAAIGILLAGGFTAEVAAKAYTAVGHYVVGFATQLRAGGTSDEKEENHDLREFYRTLDPARYPATVASAAFLPISLDDEFRFGLQLIVDGLARQLPHAGDRAPRG